MSTRLGRTFGGSVVLLLAGPVLWTGHFLAAYFFAELACAAGWLRSEIAGVSALVLITVIVTFAAAAASVVFGVAGFRARTGPHGDLAFAGFLLSALGAIVIVFVGISPAFHEPC